MVSLKCSRQKGVRRSLLYEALRFLADIDVKNQSGLKTGGHGMGVIPVRVWLYVRLEPVPVSRKMIGFQFEQQFMQRSKRGMKQQP